MKTLLSIPVCILLSFAASMGAYASEIPYDTQEISPNTLNYPKIARVDLGPYTTEAVRQKIREARNGVRGAIRLLKMKGLPEMRALYSDDGLFRMGLMQGSLPEVIYVGEGVVTLGEVSRAYPKLLVHEQDRTYLARLPIVVGIGATLIIEDSTLKLLEEKGTCLSNGGTVFLAGSKLTGWRGATNTPATYTGERKKFRPYFISWGGSRSYFASCEVSHLGYHRSKSYGITFSSYNVKPNEKMFAGTSFDFTAPATGWIVDSTFRGMYYGFYCYEAEDIAIVNNVYVDNIIYGIDPHDRSSGLIIAGNTVHGTKKKHGIIISREVNDSFIVGNEVFDNRISGIMLDRQCERTLVAENTVYRNGGDGITLYESGDNIIHRNTVFLNKNHGIRLRNSQDVVLTDNIVLNNKKFGVYLHTRDLSDIERDLELDPYDQIVSGTLLGGTVSYNKSGSISLENFDTFTLYGVMIENKEYGKLFFGGDAMRFHSQLARALSGGYSGISLSRHHE